MNHSILFSNGDNFLQSAYRNDHIKGIPNFINHLILHHCQTERVRPNHSKIVAVHFKQKPGKNRTQILLACSKRSLTYQITQGANRNTHTVQRFQIRPFRKIIARPTEHFSLVLSIRNNHLIFPIVGVIIKDQIGIRQTHDKIAKSFTADNGIAFFDNINRYSALNA